MQSSLWPLEVSLRATRSRESSMDGGRETRITEGKTKRGNDSDTTMSLINSCAARMKPNGAKATARTEPRRRGTITASPTVLTAETNWGRRTGRTWVIGRNASETRWARRWAWVFGGGGELGDNWLLRSRLQIWFLICGCCSMRVPLCRLKSRAARLSHVPALFSPCRTVQPCSSTSQAHATASAWVRLAKATTASPWAPRPNLCRSIATMCSLWQRGWKRGSRRARMSSDQPGCSEEMQTDDSAHEPKLMLSAFTGYYWAYETMINSTEWALQKQTIF